MDRTIHFGDDAADARYRIQDTSSTGGDFVVAEDLDGGTVLLEYDYSASEWVSRGPVNLSGNDITNAGSITADALEAESVDITPVDSGKVTVSASSKVTLVQSSTYESDYYDLAMSADAGTGAVRRVINHLGSGQTRWELEETTDNDVTVNWAVIRYAIQP